MKNTPRTYTLNQIFEMISQNGVVGIYTPNGRNVEADRMEIYRAKNGETILRFVGTTPENSASFRVTLDTL
jgi:hypothetical protein